jgi:alcohol dehydrogenase class IV
LFITDKGIASTSIIDDVKKALGTDTPVYDGVEPDPSIQSIEAAKKLLREAAPDVLIAEGGGSSIDTSKALSIILANDIALVDFPTSQVSKSLPLISIPTTAGSGSEVTQFIVVKDLDTHRKYGMGSDLLRSRTAIIDPLLMSNMPAHIAAATGADALIHALESYAGLRANPVSDALALQAIRLISRNLRAVVANRKNLQAMTDVALGSTLAGMSFGNASTTLVHAMSQALGGHVKIAHGIANAILLPTILRFMNL